VELYATHAHQAELTVYDFELLMCHCPLSSLSTTFDENYGWGTPSVLVEQDTLHIDWQSSAPGWNGFDLDTNFDYNGTDNLVVEFRYMGHSGTTVNARALSLPSADRCLDAGLPDSPTGDLMSFLTCMRLHFTPAGVEEEGLEEQPAPSVSVGSNPACGMVELCYCLPEPGEAILSVLSIDGRVVWQCQSQFLSAGEHIESIDLSILPRGLYVAGFAASGSFCSALFVLL
jgi:hypothetical protein